MLLIHPIIQPVSERFPEMAPFHCINMFIAASIHDTSQRLYVCPSVSQSCVLDILSLWGTIVGDVGGM
jgi:hypothetical protein